MTVSTESSRGAQIQATTGTSVCSIHLPVREHAQGEFSTRVFVKNVGKV